MPRTMSSVIYDSQQTDSCIAGSPYMPHAQRIYGIFWGSATAQQLQNQGVIAGTPAVTSQPATAYDVKNSVYFTVPVK